jgi:hypothetical protein
MNDKTMPTPCTIDPEVGHCVAYRPGHMVHVIQANLVGHSPWGWRDSVIASVSPDGWIEIDYIADSGRVRAWHHEDLAELLAPGTPVRIHEEFHVLGAPFGWICLFIASGLGKVPEPEDPNLWLSKMTVGVTNLGTGRALAMDHEHLTDEVE